MKRDAVASGERNNDAGGHRNAPFGRVYSGRGVVEPLVRSKGYALRDSPNPGLNWPRQNDRIWSESALVGKLLEYGIDASFPTPLIGRKKFFGWRDA